MIKRTCALLALWTMPLFGQAAVATFTYSTSYTTATTGYVAILDISASGLLPQVTSASPACAAKSASVMTMSTKNFATMRNAFVAVTANAGPAISGPKPQCGTPSGLIVSKGQWVNWPQTNGPILYFTSNGSATITDGAVPLLSQITNAVAGTTTQDNDCASCTAGTVLVQESGTLLVKNGSPGICPVPKSGTKAARGAIGLDATNHYLIVLVVEGAEGASGLYTPDFALLMLAFGGVNAINFDGGGSTVFDWNPKAGVPAACTNCASMIAGATIPSSQPNPNSLTLTNITAQKPNTAIYYTSEADGRAVYASIGFSLTASGSRR